MLFKLSGWIISLLEALSGHVSSSYDHLTQLLMRVMDERPQNVVDVVEDMSRDVKLGVFEGKQSTLRDLPHIEATELLAEQQRLLFARTEEADQEEELV